MLPENQGVLDLEFDFDWGSCKTSPKWVELPAKWYTLRAKLKSKLRNRPRRPNDIPLTPILTRRSHGFLSLMVVPNVPFELLAQLQGDATSQVTKELISPNPGVVWNDVSSQWVIQVVVCSLRANSQVSRRCARM